MAVALAYYFPHLREIYSLRNNMSIEGIEVLLRNLNRLQLLNIVGNRFGTVNRIGHRLESLRALYGGTSVGLYSEQWTAK